MPALLYLAHMYTCSVWGDCRGNGIPLAPNSLHYGNIVLGIIHVILTSDILKIGKGLEDPSVISSLLDVNTCPGKPQYNMASEVPLVRFMLWLRGSPFVNPNSYSSQKVLYDCEYEGLEFKVSQCRAFCVLSKLISLQLHNKKSGKNSTGASWTLGLERLCVMAL